MNKIQTLYVETGSEGNFLNLPSSGQVNPSKVIKAEDYTKIENILWSSLYAEQTNFKIHKIRRMHYIGYTVGDNELLKS